MLLYMQFQSEAKVTKMLGAPLKRGDFGYLDSLCEM